MQVPICGNSVHNLRSTVKAESICFYFSTQSKELNRRPGSVREKRLGKLRCSGFDYLRF